MMIRIRIEDEDQGLRIEEVLRMGLRSCTFVAVFVVENHALFRTF